MTSNRPDADMDGKWAPFADFLDATDAVDPEARDDKGWMSPCYKTSRKVQLDPVRAEVNRCVCLSSGAKEIEYYRMLRTQIQQRCLSRGWSTIMVTSANPGEGKSLTAINLALTFAREFDQTVLLVDADLRKQQVHQYLGYESPYSLVDYLENRRPLSDIIVWPGVEKMTVISGRHTVSDSAEILASPRMNLLVEEMKNRYAKRYVLFDVPPVLHHADAMAFAPLVDGILLLAAPGTTRRDDIVKATELLPRDKFIGVALNRYGRCGKGGPKGGGETVDGWFKV